MSEKHLNINLEKLQSESVNDGGIWRFLELPIQNTRNLKEFFKTKAEEVKINSVFNERTKEFLSDSIDHWSAYSGPCSECSENSNHYNKLKASFINNIFDFIDKKVPVNVYCVENLDSRLNAPRFPRDQEPS